MNKIDEDGLRDLFIAHGAIPNKRFRKGKLNCVQLDTNSLIHDLAEITEECLLSAAGEAKPVEITEEEIIEAAQQYAALPSVFDPNALRAGFYNGVKWRDRHV